MKNSTLIISLDFELLWGIFDKVGTTYRPDYFSNTRKVIPQMLESFAKHEIAVTWATVGMLFAENEEEWKYYSPEYKPSYRNRNLSAYEWAKQHGIKPEVHFAPDLIRQIVDTPGQELGSHTYAHYYTLMRGQSPEQFRQDIQATQRIAEDKFETRLKSLVFPRNHINELYLGICLEEGYEVVRGNPKNWFWQETQHEDLGKKIIRSADCFFEVGERSTFFLEELKAYPNEPLILPASRILRPFSPKGLGIMNRLRLNRIKQEMEAAARNGESYHLWWHPHNFGNDPQSSMKELLEVLEHFQSLRDRFGMQSLSMGQVGELIGVPSLTT
ncbi:polysaccharide deacetylase family protein [Algoriphagus sanaruensis]|uniref:Polysaccharide deacetylase n=1 Tax=Algoriphagus sanaruensis TaxID=1727163 RepID=A0A142EQR4_9BACT|nr:polysaccharide deacetylase family protein [Algoriphagus sanaruensis]AMQ57469.1 polysaccharide deacetylase [Algoriphagus sanaruensis]